MAIPLEPLFRYQVLESPTTFRLLRLHAGQGDRITGSLHHHVLRSADCPAYRAVSYTWGRDTAGGCLHLPGDSVIRVRKNLRNALRSVRDKESDCWLWIDAICIDQQSDHERNHQVRLMADIYGTANVVLVWLQSADERADVARAFKFVHAAATHDRSNQSVYHYSRAHLEDNKSNWRSVTKLCRLRYWSRKWIIQELVTARTVVLHVGDSECTMMDFERFCRELHRERENDAYKKLGPPRRNVCKSLVASPAARLALQRLENIDEQHPRLLHDLIERYANNECHLPCDHVYALYSLVGEHRRHLRIDYAATPAQRLVAVLRFVHTYEDLQPSKVLDFAQLLVRLFRIKQEDIRQELRLFEDLNLVVPPAILGAVEMQPESKGSRELRQRVNRLDPMARFVLDTSQEVWVLIANEGLNDGDQPVAQQDMTYFTIQDSGIHGLAACRLEPGDVISHFPATQLVFAVRRTPGQRALIVGRAYLFFPARKPDTFEFCFSRPFDYNRIRQGEQQVTVDLATLLELGSLASPAKSVWKDDQDPKKKNFRFSSLMKVVIVGFGKSANRHEQSSGVIEKLTS